MTVRVFLAVLSVAALARADGRDDAFESFFKDEIAGRWASATYGEERAVMLRGFDKHDTPAAATWLMEHGLSDEAGVVAREAVRILTLYKRPATVAAMAEYWEKKTKRTVEVRTLALLAFAKKKDDVARATLVAALKDRDARVVASACRAIGLGSRFELRAELEELLRHKHPAARAAAVEALGDIGGEASLPWIFPVFCGDPSHRVRYDAWIALRKLTPRKLECSPEAWHDFWKTRAGEIDVPEGGKNPWGKRFPRIAPAGGTTGTFFRIPVLADRLVFVYDVNGRMANSWRIDVKEERKKPKEEQTPNFFGVKTRWDLVRAWTKRCLDELPETVEIAFVFFNDEVQTYPEKPKYFRNKKALRAKLLKHLDEGVKIGATSSMYEGLAAGWGFLKEGDPKTNFTKGCDTLIFVTNSKPSSGAFKNKEDALRDEIWRVARARNLRLHMVGMHNHAFALLQDAAKQGGGLYVHAQMAGDTAEPQDLEFWPEKKKAFEAARRARKKAG